jgi:hypothetical protein
LGWALQRFRDGQFTAAEVVAQMNHGGVPFQIETANGDVWEQDQEDPGVVAEDTFDEVSAAYHRGELSDDQYAALYEAVTAR